MYFGEECEFFCHGLHSTNFQLVDVFLDVASLYYNPNFSQKRYFVSVYNNPAGDPSFVRLMYVQFTSCFHGVPGGCEGASNLILLNNSY